MWSLRVSSDLGKFWKVQPNTVIRWLKICGQRWIYCTSRRVDALTGARNRDNAFSPYIILVGQDLQYCGRSMSISSTINSKSDVGIRDRWRSKVTMSCMFPWGFSPTNRAISAYVSLEKKLMSMWSSMQNIWTNQFHMDHGRKKTNGPNKIRCNKLRLKSYSSIMRRRPTSAEPQLLIAEHSRLWRSSADCMFGLSLGALKIERNRIPPYPRTFGDDVLR